MDADYKAKMACAEKCEQIISRFREGGDPAGTPRRRNFASKAQRDCQEVVRCYQEAIGIYCQFNQEDKARDLLANLLDLVQTCDESTSSLAIRLLLTLRDSLKRLQGIAPGTCEQLKRSLQRAISQKLLQQEMDFWMLRSAPELLRDLADNDQERHMIDEFLCRAMHLAAVFSFSRGNVDGAEGWYRDAARVAQDRLGNTEWANSLLQSASTIQQMRLKRPASPAFVQAMESEAPSSPEYVEAMRQMDVGESLNVLVHKALQEQHKERFLPSPEEFQTEYASADDKLAKLLADERLLLDDAAVETRATKYRGQGLLGWLPGKYVNAQGHPRGDFDTDARFTVQYVAEVAEIIGTLFLVWQEAGDLEEQQVVALLRQAAPSYDWRIFEVGLSRHFHGDHVCAAHTLIPQFESVVRTWAQNAGVNVGKLKGGVPGGQLLHDLVNPSNAEMRTLLGAGLFDLIWWYLVNSGGPFGYRHKIAHGWIRPEECEWGHLSAMTIWLTLRVIERQPDVV
jgi:hypothetical protein